MDEGDGENVEPQDEQQMEVEENRREEEFAAERFLLEDTEELDFQSFLTMVASKKVKNGSLKALVCQALWTP